MGFFIFFCVLLFIVVAFLFFFIGGAVYQSKVRKHYKLNKEDSFFKLSRPADLIFGLSMLLVWAFFMSFICGFQNLRGYYCKRFDDGKIVKQVNYKYWNVNGEQVLKDSTITYVPHKKKGNNHE